MPAPSLSRRRALVGALPLFFIGTRRARAAQYTIKISNSQAISHPLNQELLAASKRLLESSSGALELRVFPDSQLGSEIDLVTQLRSGALDMMNVSSLVLSSAVPITAIANVGFAFPDTKTAFATVDGKLGDFIRAQIEKSGFAAPFRMGNSGFRQITSSTKPIETAADLKGFRLRVPVSPLNLSLFKALDAAPTTVNFNETYTALQTKLVEGQENPLIVVDSSKLYEVQKYCAMTNHIWDGYWFLLNRRLPDRLPKPMRDMLYGEIEQVVTAERAGTEAIDADLRQSLEKKGLRFLEVDRGGWRSALAKTDFYPFWRNKFGPEAWNLLQASTGPLG